MKPTSGLATAAAAVLTFAQFAVADKDFTANTFLRRAVQASTCSQKIYQNTDFYGNDIGSASADDYTRCCSICSATPGCNAYTWTSYDNGRCWLKSINTGTTNNRQPAPGATAGELTASCNVQLDTDYYGNDLPNGQILSKQAGDCCALCRSVAGCGAYAWSNYNGGTCFLKSTKGTDIRRAPGVVAGTPGPVQPTTPPSTTAAPSTCQQEANKDYNGNDLPNGEKLGKAEDCCGLCKSTPGCAAYTWANKNGGTCWLKSQRGSDIRTLNGAISGYIPGATVPPTTTPPSGYNYYKTFDFNSFPYSDFSIDYCPQQVSTGGGVMTLKMDRSCGTRLKSLKAFDRLKISSKIQVPGGPEPLKGVVTAFYLSSGEGSGNQDEIDFEFLGKDVYSVQTNYFKNGKGGNEKIIPLNFDPRAGLHTYTMEIGEGFISWSIDGQEVRRVSDTLSKAQNLYISFWDGSAAFPDWAGAPINWNYSPFYAKFSALTIAGRAK